MIHQHERYTTLWNRIRYRICSLSWDLLLSRSHNKAYQLVDWDTSMLKISFISFDSASVKAIVRDEKDPNQVAIDISGVLEEKYEDIKKCYFFYNSMESNNNKMCSSDFLLFLRDTGIISKTITIRIYKNILIEKVRNLFEKPLIPGSEPEEKDIEPPQFVRRICHLAYLHYNKSKPLVEALKDFLNDYIIPNTGKNGTYEFRKNLSKPSVRVYYN